jgi:hypothetical protein
MAFDIIFQQVRAVAQVTQSLGGQVSSAYGRMALGQMTSAMLGAQLMLGDALRLAAILEDADYMEELDLLAKEEVSPDNSGAYILMIRDLGRQQEEVEMLQEVVQELEQALDLLQEQVGVVETLTHSIRQMANATDRADSVFGEALSALESQVLPQLYAFQDRLEDMLEFYRDTLHTSQGNLWYLETVFKFIMPFLRALKQRRQRKLREEEHQNQQEEEEAAEAKAQEEPEKQRQEPQERQQLRQAIAAAAKARGRTLTPQQEEALARLSLEALRQEAQRDPEEG